MDNRTSDEIFDGMTQRGRDALNELVELIVEYHSREDVDDPVSKNIYETLFLDTVGTLVASVMATTLGDVAVVIQEHQDEINDLALEKKTSYDMGVEDGANMILSNLREIFGVGDIELLFERFKTEFVEMSEGD